MPKWQRQSNDGKPKPSPSFPSLSFSSFLSWQLHHWADADWDVGSCWDNTVRRRVSLSVNCCSFTFWVWLRISTRSSRYCGGVAGACSASRCHFAIFHPLFKYLIKRRHGNFHFACFAFSSRSFVDYNSLGNYFYYSHTHKHRQTHIYMSTYMHTYVYPTVLTVCLSISLCSFRKMSRTRQRQMQFTMCIYLTLLSPLSPSATLSVSLLCHINCNCNWLSNSIRTHMLAAQQTQHNLLFFDS